MSNRDQWYNKAKQQGYRSRSAYKLQQLDDLETVLPEGGTVVDLGAAPGGWLQVAAERVGPRGTVLGVDLQRIKDIETEATVETIRGDLTEPETHEEVRDRVGEVDTVLSDMAPNMTGEYNLDHARSVYLAGQAADVAREVLKPGGNLVVKVFEGPDLADFRSGLESEYGFVRTTSPEASRKESSEVYLIAKGLLTAPVEVGQELAVEIESVGSEGDGVAQVEGFTVFVPGTEEGETVEVRIEDVKQRFAFAERL
jgi:23S rRNA (uridine2552-2'-O)-methyltransferase